MSKEKNKKDEDIIIEEANEEANESAEEAIKKIKEKLKHCESQKGEYLSGWQRTKADFINARKEEGERRESFMKFSERELILRFLDLADSFDGLFADKKAWEAIDKNWRQGVENLHGQLADILKKRKVEAIGAVDKIFNPQEHESIGEIKVDKKEKEGIVIEELRKGYKMHDAVIRPSLVKIGKLS
jgi:molecular chaperone GrpE